MAVKLIVTPKGLIEKNVPPEQAAFVFEVPAVTKDGASIGGGGGAFAVWAPFADPLPQGAVRTWEEAVAAVNKIAAPETTLYIVANPFTEEVTIPAGSWALNNTTLAAVVGGLDESKLPTGGAPNLRQLTLRTSADTNDPTFLSGVTGFKGLEVITNSANATVHGTLGTFASASIEVVEGTRRMTALFLRGDPTPPSSPSPLFGAAEVVPDPFFLQSDVGKALRNITLGEQPTSYKIIDVIDSGTVKVLLGGFNYNNDCSNPLNPDNLAALHKDIENNVRQVSWYVSRPLITLADGAVHGRRGIIASSSYELNEGGNYAQIDVLVSTINSSDPVFTTGSIGSVVYFENLSSNVNDKTWVISDVVSGDYGNNIGVAGHPWAVISQHIDLPVTSSQENINKRNGLINSFNDKVSYLTDPRGNKMNWQIRTGSTSGMSLVLDNCYIHPDDYSSSGFFCMTAPSSLPRITLRNSSRIGAGSLLMDALSSPVIDMDASNNYCEGGTWISFPPYASQDAGSFNVYPMPGAVLDKPGVSDYGTLRNPATSWDWSGRGEEPARKLPA